MAIAHTRPSTYPGHPQCPMRSRNALRAIDMSTILKWTQIDGMSKLIAPQMIKHDPEHESGEDDVIDNAREMVK